MFLNDVYLTLADTYEAIDFRIVLVENTEIHQHDLIFLKMVWCVDSNTQTIKKWDFYRTLNKESRLKFINKSIEKKNIHKFFDSLMKGFIQIDNYVIQLSDMEKMHLSSDFDVNQLFANLPELYPKNVEFPYLLIRPDYDKSCSLILNFHGIPMQIKGIETLKIIESFLDVKGTILVNSRIVIILPIYCKLFDSKGPTIEYNNKLIDKLNLLIINDEIRSIPFESVDFISHDGMNIFELQRYFKFGNEKINVRFDPLELIIINHENENLIEFQHLNIFEADSETNQKLIKISENQRLEKKSSFRYNHQKNEIDENMPFTIMRSIASMLNTEGGVLLLGVGNEDELLGLEKDIENLPNRNNIDGFEVFFRNWIRDKYFRMNYVNSLLQLLFPQINGKTICKIIINKSPKPIFLINKDKCNVFFIRQGNGVRELNGLELSEYLSNFDKRSNANYDFFDNSDL
ncbi:MAG: helix-turn-helix domain-containing protein [Candidatus Nitrosocosmicus sp.]